MAIRRVCVCLLWFVFVWLVCVCVCVRVRARVPVRLSVSYVDVVFVSLYLRSCLPVFVFAFVTQQTLTYLKDLSPLIQHDYITKIETYFLILSPWDAAISRAFWTVEQIEVMAAIFSLKLFPFSWITQ